MKTDHLKVALGLGATFWLICLAIGALLGDVQDLQMVADVAAIVTILSGLALVGSWGWAKLTAPPPKRRKSRSHAVT